MTRRPRAKPEGGYAVPKVYIIGIVASGKTTLARRLSKEWNVPHYELDCVVHVGAGREQYKRTPEQQVQEILRIDREGDWIIEGTYRESCRCVLDLADRIIFLDPPLWLRRIRIFTRYVKQRLGIEACHYRSNLWMLRKMYAWTHAFEKDRSGFEAMLAGYGDKVVKIRNPGSFS